MSVLFFMENMKVKLITKKNSVRRKDYSKEESEYQEAQKNWKETGKKIYWDKMFSLINLATFNCVNKKLEYLLEKEEIEQRALDVTMNIMQGILKKKSKGEAWEIKKLSSYVHLPCLSIYAEKLKFEDNVLTEETFLNVDEHGNEEIKETEESIIENGILKLNKNR